MHGLLADITHEFRRHKVLADTALSAVREDDLVARPAPHVNSLAHIVKHLAGNLTSRWTNFLTSDGEKPTRNRDSEFVITAADTPALLQTAWEEGWAALFDTLEELAAAEASYESTAQAAHLFSHQITIRGEAQTVQQALLRGLDHVAYHTGQILYIVRLLAPDSPYQTIAPNRSAEHVASYRQT